MTISPAPLRGLYAITSESLNAEPEALLAAVAAALRGGASLIQYRAKTGTVTQRESLALRLVALCHAHRARLIVNDDLELACRTGADGVHLGAADPPLAQARARLGARAIIGASCGPSLQRALDAIAQHADYVAFGRFFDSRTKPNAPAATLELLQQARARLAEPRTPICAIGGITPTNAGAVIAAGADLVAAVGGVFGDPRPEAVTAAARAYVAQFD